MEDLCCLSARDALSYSSAVFGPATLERERERGGEEKGGGGREREKQEQKEIVGKIILVTCTTAYFFCSECQIIYSWFQVKLQMIIPLTRQIKFGLL